MYDAPSEPTPPAFDTANANVESPTRPIDACITGHRDPNAEPAEVIPTTDRPWTDPTNRQPLLAAVRTVTSGVPPMANSAQAAWDKVGQNGTYASARASTCAAM